MKKLILESIQLISLTENVSHFASLYYQNQGLASSKALEARLIFCCIAERTAPFGAERGNDKFMGGTVRGSH